MKNFKLIIPLFLFSIAIFIFACGNSNKAKDPKGKEYTSAYICPMYCTGSGSDKAGICPVCKMDYVANKDVKSSGTEIKENHDGHDHDNHDGHDHSGHDHGSHEGHNH